ncbi:hypothetical protein L1A70_14810 [Acinetobacter bereziniae]
MLIWKAYRAKYGSLFVGRRIEQAVGRFHSFYAIVNSKEEHRDKIDPFDFMPHEEGPPTTFEEERMKAIKKKST